MMRQQRSRWREWAWLGGFAALVVGCGSAKSVASSDVEADAGYAEPAYAAPTYAPQPYPVQSESYDAPSAMAMPEEPAPAPTSVATACLRQRIVADCPGASFTVL